jgi:hypothetical protein
MLGFSFNTAISSPARGTGSPIKSKLRLSRVPNGNSIISKNVSDTEVNDSINKNSNSENISKLEENVLTTDNNKDVKQSNNQKMKKYTTKENDQSVDVIEIVGTFISSIFKHEDSDKRNRGKLSRKKKEDDESSEKSSASLEIASTSLLHNINPTLTNTNSDLESLSETINDETMNSSTSESISNQSIIYSQGKSFSRGKLHQYVRVRKVSADADDDYEEQDDNSIINNINQSPNSVSSKDGTNNNDITMLLALWTASMPAELQEDLADLGTQMMTDLGTLQSPYVSFKKLIKNQFNSDSIS